MVKNTGIVMELGKKYAIIMTSTGEFLKVASKNTNPKLGEIYTGEAVKSTPIYKYALTAASLIFILLFGSSAYAYYTPTASVKVDINPSLRLDINRWNRIIKSTALNSDGEKVLSGISLKNKPINNGLNLIVEEAKKDNFINDDYINQGRVIKVAIENAKNNRTIDLSAFGSYAKKNNLKLNVTEKREADKTNLKEENSSSDNNSNSPNNKEKGNSANEQNSGKGNNSKSAVPSQTKANQDKGNLKNNNPNSSGTNDNVTKENKTTPNNNSSKNNNKKDEEKEEKDNSKKNADDYSQSGNNNKNKDNKNSSGKHSD